MIRQSIAETTLHKQLKVLGIYMANIKSDIDKLRAQLAAYEEMSETIVSEINSLRIARIKASEAKKK